jgi:hypothetical protein
MNEFGVILKGEVHARFLKLRKFGVFILHFPFLLNFLVDHFLRQILRRFKGHLPLNLCLLLFQRFKQNLNIWLNQLVPNLYENLLEIFQGS